jgi:hypothetical protein
MSEVGSWIEREPNPTEGDHEIGANPLAAMPSDHLASAAMTAMLLLSKIRSSVPWPGAAPSCSDSRWCTWVSTTSSTCSPV